MMFSTSQRGLVLRYIVVLTSILLYGCSMWLRASFMPLTDAFRIEFPGVQEQDLSTLAAVFFIAYTPILFASGLLLQIVSSELAVIIPTMLSGVLSILIYTASSFHTLIVIRVLLGISCSTCWLGTLSMIQHYFSLNDIPFFAGLALLVGQMGPIWSIYQSYLYEHYNMWRLPFLWMGIVIEVLCLFLLGAFIVDRSIIISRYTAVIAPKKELKDPEITSLPLSWWKWIKLWCSPRSHVFDLSPSKTQSHSENVSKDQIIGINQNMEGIEGIESNSNSSTIVIKEEDDINHDGNESNHSEDPITTIPYTLWSKVISALRNPYNYLFAVIHSCLCIPQAILGAQWLKEYLMVKFQNSTGIAMDGTKANMIASCTNIGAAGSSLLFGFIGKRYQEQYPSIYRTLVISGFILWSTSLLMIYVPNQYHSEWNLFLFATTSGSGMGAITIVFAGIRKVNEKQKCEDFASGMVSSTCMAVMWASYEITGKLFAMVKDESSATSTANQHSSEEEFNYVFCYIIAAISVGLVASMFVPKM